METEDFLCTDRIYDYLLENNLTDLRRLLGFLPNSDAELPQRNKEKKIRRLLENDIRFREKKPGFWCLRSFNLNTSIDQQRFCVFDLETTGGRLPLHRIIEIGAVIVQAGQVIDEFVSFVQPFRPIPEYVSRLTGISDADLKDAPDIEEVLEKFERFSQDCFFCAHGAAFDMGCLNGEAQMALKKSFFSESLCTLKLSRYLVHDSINHKVDGLCHYFNISIENRHRALGDSKATAQMLIKLLERYKISAKSNSLDGLLKFCVQIQGSSFGNEPPHPDLLLIEPKALANLPDQPGIVNFWLHNGKRLNSLSMKNMRQEMAYLWYFASEQHDATFYAVRRAVFFSYKQEKSSLLADLQSPIVNYYSSKKKPLYLKVFSYNGGRLFLTSRKLNDDAFYYGPFTNDSAEFKQVERGLKIEKTGLDKHPPKSCIIKEYSGHGLDLEAFLREIFYTSGREANFLLRTENGGEGSFYVFFFREGYAVKSKSLQKDKLDLSTAKNFLRQVLEHFYGKNSLKQVVNVSSPEQTAKYNTIMRWLYKDYPSEEAQVYFLPAMNFFNIDDADLEPIAAWLLETF